MEITSVGTDHLELEKVKNESLSNKSIFLQNGQLIIQNYRTHDDEVVAYFQNIPAEHMVNDFRSALKAGIIALRTIRTTEKIDYIEKAFLQLQNKFEDALTKTTNNLSENIDDVFSTNGKLPSLMEENFGEKGTVTELIDAYFGENGKIIRELFDPLKEGTPLHQLKTLLLDELNNMKTAIGINEAKEQIKQQTPLKGLDFETMCGALLGDIVQRYKGDEIEHTGDRIGKITKNKKGDFVIKVNGDPERKIVIETKDKDSISLAEIHNELDNALENREAEYSIFVAKWVDSLPNSVGCFNFYHGNKIVCALGHQDQEEINSDILEVAYCWARTQLLLDATSKQEIDYKTIRSTLIEIEKKLRKFRSVKTQCTNIDNASKKIREICDNIKEDITSNLEEALQQFQ